MARFKRFLESAPLCVSCLPIVRYALVLVLLCVFFIASKVFLAIGELQAAWLTLISFVLLGFLLRAVEYFTQLAGDIRPEQEASRIVRVPTRVSNRTEDADDQLPTNVVPLFPGRTTREN